MNAYATKLDNGTCRFAFSIGEKNPENRKFDLICDASRSALNELRIQLCNSIVGFNLDDENLTDEEKNEILKIKRNEARNLFYGSDIIILDLAVPQDLKAYRDGNYGRYIVETDCEEEIAMYRAIVEELKSRETVWDGIISSLPKEVTV
jgi:hypothetical protein